MQVYLSGRVVVISNKLRINCWTIFLFGCDSVLIWRVIYYRSSLLSTLLGQVDITALLGSSAIELQRNRLTQCVSSVTSFWSQQISQYWLADQISKGSRLFGVTSSSWGHPQSRQRYDKLWLLAISEAILNFQGDSSWLLTHNNKIDTSEVHGTTEIKLSLP